MKQKNNDLSERLRRRIPIIVSSIVLYGFFLLIAVQSIPLVITYREVAQCVSPIMLACGLLIPIGIAGWQIAIHKIPNLLINPVEIPNVDMQTSLFQLTDDGEIIEIADDQKPKRGGDSAGE